MKSRLPCVVHRHGHLDSLGSTLIGSQIKQAAAHGQIVQKMNHLVLILERRLKDVKAITVIAWPPSPGNGYGSCLLP